MLIELFTPTVTASIASRTITGRIVTFNETSRQTSAGVVRFTPGSISIPAEVPLNLEHDRTRPIGRATRVDHSPTGIDAAFKVIGTRTGDDSLVEAAEGLRGGFSVGVEVSDYTYDGDVMVVNASELNHVALVTEPAILSSRVTDVAASEQAPETTDPAPAGPVEPETEAEVTPVVDTTEAAPVVEATATPEPVYVAAARVQDAFPYGPQATHLSFFRDIHNAPRDVEAASRAHKANAILIDAATTSIVPPGYRPDLYVDQLRQLTPVASLCSQFTITDATAFVVPTFASSTGLVEDVVSGTNPASGSVSTSSVTVTPKAVSGICDIPRDVIDASNPGIDQIVMTAMMEDYSRDLEALVCTVVLAGATAGIAGATLKYTKAIIDNAAAYPFVRFLPVDGIAVGPTAFKQLVAEEDTAGRPKNPYLNPSNAMGQTGPAAASLSVSGVVVTGAWSLPVQQLLFLRKSDAAVFTSGPREFREEGGTLAPGNVRFALWGYTGAAVLRAVGVVKATQTP